MTSCKKPIDVLLDEDIEILLEIEVAAEIDDADILVDVEQDLVVRTPVLP